MSLPPLQPPAPPSRQPRAKASTVSCVHTTVISSARTLLGELTRPRLSYPLFYR
ncbi:hypothetical protein J6590_030334 [Homalodisca vitripennis]|nr:hypothetical protein J6590_030334 [Homalodisca vitripennis]